MNPRTAYVVVLLIWSTTPLAIKWSGEGPGFSFGVTSRMLLGLVVVYLLLYLRRVPLRLDRAARLTYLAGAIGIYGAMSCAYWGAQFIPSGWISILFGLAPLMTALLSAVILGERSLTPLKLFAQALGIGGLAIVFASALDIGMDAVRGMLAVLTAALLHSISAVLVKRIGAGLPALAATAGSLACALPAYLLTWAVVDGRPPAALPTHAVISILYLGSVATVAGFTLYYYILKHTTPTQVAMVAMVSPVAAVLLGSLVNGEPIGPRVLMGGGLIVVALYLHEAWPLRGLRRGAAMRAGLPDPVAGEERTSRS